MFSFEPLLREPVADRRSLYDTLVGRCLGIQSAAFEGYQPVRQGVVLICVADILSHKFHQIGQGHHGAADNEVELSLLVLGALLYALDVCQSQCFGNG